MVLPVLIKSALLEKSHTKLNYHDKHSFDLCTGLAGFSRPDSDLQQCHLTFVKSACLLEDPLSGEQAAGPPTVLYIRYTAVLPHICLLFRPRGIKGPFHEYVLLNKKNTAVFMR